MTLEYYGVFEAGVQGCFTEEQMRAAVANRLNPEPSVVIVEKVLDTKLFSMILTYFIASENRNGSKRIQIEEAVNSGPTQEAVPRYYKS